MKTETQSIEDRLRFAESALLEMSYAMANNMIEVFSKHIGALVVLEIHTHDETGKMTYDEAKAKELYKEKVGQLKVQIQGAVLDSVGAGTVQ